MRWYVKGSVELEAEKADDAMDELESDFGGDWEFELVEPFRKKE